MKLNELSIEELESRKEFVKVLGEYAKRFTDKIQNVILNHIEDLYQDKTFCLILKEWFDEKQRAERYNQDEFLHAYLAEREVNYYKSVNDYSDTLYLLCVNRYRNEIKEGE